MQDRSRRMMQPLRLTGGDEASHDENIAADGTAGVFTCSGSYLRQGYTFFAFQSYTPERVPA